MNKHAQELGRLGGKKTSEAKAKAARENGKKGGRPLDPKCEICGQHHWINSACRTAMPQ